MLLIHHFRDAAAFAFMWVGVTLVYPCALAIQSSTFGRYIVDGLSPAIKFDEPVENLLEWLLAVGLICK